MRPFRWAARLNPARCPARAARSTASPAAPRSHFWTMPAASRKFTPSSAFFVSRTVERRADHGPGLARECVRDIIENAALSYRFPRNCRPASSKKCDSERRAGRRPGSSGGHRAGFRRAAQPERPRLPVPSLFTVPVPSPCYLGRFVDFIGFLHFFATAVRLKTETDSTGCPTSLSSNVVVVYRKCLGHPAFSRRG